MRERLDDGGGLYQIGEPATEVFTSGCTVLDQILGGGWAVGRVINLVGDKSTGKTLLAIEACANFAKAYPGAPIHYAEAESAFDSKYAESLGLPLKRVTFSQVLTVEDVYDNLVALLDNMKGERGLYILDSLDAVGDDAENKREFGEASYGGTKPKQIGALFRRLIQRVGKKKVCLIIVSQIRDAIGVTFGRKHSRSGGRALDFYASQIIWLAHLKRIQRTRKKVKRVVGVEIRAKCEKNKVGSPHRECEFPIYFNYGVEDLVACLQFLIEVGRADAVKMSLVEAKKLSTSVDKLDQREYDVELKRARKAVVKVWKEIEASFTPKRRKY